MTFKDVGSQTIDLQNVQVYKNGVLYENSLARLAFQKMLIDGDNEGSYDNTKIYSWKKKSGVTGWYKGNDYCKDEFAVQLMSGEGLSVNNTSGGELTLRVSGEVELNPWSMEIPTGFSLIGNMTPVTLDLQDVKVYKADKETLYENSLARLAFQKMLIDGDNEGSYDNTKIYSWKKKSGVTGWYKGNDYCKDEFAVSLAPGEAVSVNNTSGTPLFIKYKSPAEAK